jgi:UDP-glucose 4-epimerase
MRALVTGGAGFIGSNLADRLLDLGHEVTVYDDFSTGLRRFVEHNVGRKGYTLVEASTLDLDRLRAALRGHDTVFHLAANADVRFGLDHPKRDLEQNTIATFNVLEAMRLEGVKRIGFSSTGSIYGEPDVHPTPETCPFPVQTSLYGASKLAGEGLIAAFCTGYGMTGWVFRFVSILGERYTHGHIFDFVRALRRDPTRLKVLGNGLQRKSYLYVKDCLDAILTVAEKHPQGFHVYNLGTDHYCNVNDSIARITKRLGLSPKLEYTGGERGWVGDSPFIFLDTKKVRSLGWTPRLTILDAVEKTVDWLLANPHVLEERR